jgi:hypothetical protein
LIVYYEAFMNTRALLSLLAACTLVTQASAQLLPEGGAGIASRYPSDVGIASDPSVVFSDDFESYSTASALTNRWTRTFQAPNIRIATEPGNFYSGTKAIEFTVPQQGTEASGTVIKAISPGRDILFLRYYGKFDSGFNVIGSSHIGSTMSGNYCCAGLKADGYNQFFVSYEAGREETSIASPGKLRVYVYHPDQRDIWGDHYFPTGVVSPFTAVPGSFGSTFVARPDIVPQLGRWYAYELMVKVNTPGQRDGRIAMWLDGQLVADFPNLRLRETTNLKIDQISVDLYVKSNTRAAARRWIDNVVVATSYIGPVAIGPVAGSLLPPTNLRVQ